MMTLTRTTSRGMEYEQFDFESDFPAGKSEAWRMDRENFYILLELEYDPPVSDSAQIQMAIRMKKREWTRWQDVPEMRGLGLANLSLLPEIKRVMLDEELRVAEAQMAMSVRAEMLKQFEAELRILEGKGYILPKEAGAIAVKYKMFGVDRQRIEATAHCPITDRPARPKARSIEVLSRKAAKAIQGSLASLGYHNLYTFLGQQPHVELEKLQEAARRKAEAAANDKSSEGAAVQELAGVCMHLFSDKPSKQSYDHYLQVSRYPALCDIIDEEFARCGHLSASSLLRMVNFGVEKYGIKVLDAERAIRLYCAAYEIPVGEPARKTICPACGNKTDRDGAVCSVCAAPLRGECPSCGEPFAHGPSVCGKCGFALVDMVKALRSIGDAENALIESNWSAAKRHLEYVRKYWPGHPKLEVLDRRTLHLEEKYARYVDGIADCIAHNQYYAARGLIEEAAGEQIVLPTETVEHVDKVIGELKARIDAIKTAPEPPSFDVLARLAETVCDSLELNHLMRHYPPDPPEKLIASAHEKHVRLTWAASSGAGLKEYIVVRRQDVAPLTERDGEILYEGPANSFLDRSATPLTEYYYAVFTRRGGTVSAASATAGPVLLAPDVAHLRILPTDMGAQLSWDYDAGIKEVAIWRKLGGERPTAPGDGVQLETTRQDGFTDSRIRNGVEYWYFVVAVYQIGGRKVYSRGVSESVVPHKMQAPIEDLIIARSDGDENEYVASWQGSRFSDVLLYASGTRPSCRKGELRSLAELNEHYHRLELDAKQPESARFRYSWNGGIYIFPVAISGKFATVGEVRYFAKVQDVQNPTWEMVCGDIVLKMDWPEALREIIVTYRFDKYPKIPTESGANLLRYTKERYESDGGVVIPDVEQLGYHITIFSIFITPEQKRIYSPGVVLLADNTARLEVSYRFARSKKMFSQNSVIALTVHADESFTLPKGLIVGKVGRLPLSKNDGIPLFEIERETRVEGSVVYEYRTSSLPDNLYIRLFLQEEEHYDKLRLLPLGGLNIT